MKKLIILFALPLFFLSCSKDDSPLLVMVNVEYDGSIAYPTLVRLYNYDDIHIELMKQANETDIRNAYKYGSDLGFKLEDGSKIPPAYTSDSHTGANIFENVKAGKYYIIAMHKPDGFDYSLFWFYGYKEIVVDKSNNAELYTCNFPRMINGQSASGKWYHF